MATSVDSEFFGHPRGLATLFFTEMWERFSYYGMRAFLILYMVAPAAAGGLGFTDARAASIYGTYTMSVYLTAVPGGLIADYLTGARLAVFIGGIIIAARFNSATPKAGYGFELDVIAATFVGGASAYGGVGTVVGTVVGRL